MPGPQPFCKLVSHDTLKVQGEEVGFWRVLQESVSLPEGHGMPRRNSQVISLLISFLWEIVP